MVAALAGGILLAGAAWTARRDRRRAGVLALGGGALLGVGIRQRRTEDGTSVASDEATERDGPEPTGADAVASDVSAEARSHRERSDVLHQSETNPRGVSGEPDVESVTAPDEGDVQFTTEQDADEATPKPHLDGETEDTRLRDADALETRGDHVDINLSDAAMADEASEATGPTDEQSYPAREGTDPEPTSEKAPERYGEGAVANDDADTADRTDDENQGAEDESADVDDEETG
jgi:hypothetical protein